MVRTRSPVQARLAAPAGACTCTQIRYHLW
nr:MAG TPA: hypothetical protein [Caudoviricetes sp.]